MFATSFKRFYKTFDRLMVRNIRGSRHVPTGPNPGLDERIRAFQQDGLQITDENAEEFIEQSASDFYKAGDTYNDHLNESIIGKYELQHHIIKEKYFKENMPNLLTWSEKEQIRHLAEQQPDEWTPEKLAESFPVTVPTVKKLLKYVWKPATKQRIERHDASVMRNWKQLKQGSLDIPSNVKEHFLKFSKRTIPPLNKKSVAPETVKKDNQLGEFEKIVQKCAAKQTSSDNNETSEQINPENLDNQKTHKTKIDSKLVTLSELSEKIKKRLETGETVDVPDKLILSTLNAKPESVPESVELTDIELSDETRNSKENKMVAFNDEDDKGKNIMNYPERIRIPKKTYKKGATYKVNDCYYDHDGKFLYRVLGMSN